MGATLETARNELIGAFAKAWNDVAAEVGTQVMDSVTVGFFDPDGVPNEGKNPGNKPWARLTVQHTESRRPLGAKRVTRNGVVVFQAFFYRKTTAVDAAAQKFVAAVARKIETHRGEVELFEITPLERPINNGYAQTDVQARFSYTEYLR